MERSLTAMINHFNNMTKHISKDKKFVIIITFSLMAVCLQGTMIHAAFAVTSGFNNETGLSNIQIISNISLVTKILAKNLENHLQKAGAILNVTSKLPQVRNVSFAHLLNQTLTTLHGIPQGADIEKRQVGKNILASNRDLFEILFIMPNGDMYVSEPY